MRSVSELVFDKLRNIVTQRDYTNLSIKSCPIGGRSAKYCKHLKMFELNRKIIMDKARLELLKDMEGYISPVIPVIDDKPIIISRLCKSQMREGKTF